MFKLTNYKTAAGEADIIVFFVSHKEFKTLDITSQKKILDFCGVFEWYELNQLTEW